MSLAFTVPGDPRGKGTADIVKRGARWGMAQSKATVAYEGLVAHLASQAHAGRPLMEGGVVVHVRMRLLPRASASPLERHRMLTGQTPPTKKPDLDNCIKAVLDGCKTVVFRDDVQVVKLLAYKVYADTAGVDVAIHPYVPPTPDPVRAAA